MSQEERGSDSEIEAPSSDIDPPSTDTDSIMALNTNKAGMEGIDKEKINKIIIEASKGSKFYLNQTRKQKQASVRNEKLKQVMHRLPATELERARLESDLEIECLEATRDLSSVIVHVDMDAFFAAVEMRDDPSLRDIPMAVGSTSMLSTSNYVARRFGVRAGMAGFIGKKLCPNLKIIRGHYEKYREVSKVVGSVFEEYDPEFSKAGLDEGYLNLTQHLKFRIETHLTGCTPNDAVFDSLDIRSTDQYWDRDLVENVVKEMRGKIEKATQLTASAGIASNTMLSKICSDLNKPNGQFFLAPSRDEIIEFIRALPVRKVSGIGKVTEEMLKSLGIVKVQELYERRGELKRLMTDCSYQNFLRIFLGLGSTELEVRSDRKSMSTERTFREVSQPDKMYEILEKLSNDLSKDLKRKGFAGCTVGIKLKTIEFEIKTKAITFHSSTNDSKEIYNYARILLDKEIAQLKPKPLKLRLMGVRVSGFTHGEDELGQEDSDESRPKRRRVQTQKSNMSSLSDMFNNSTNSDSLDCNKITANSLQGTEEPTTASFRGVLSQQSSEDFNEFDTSPVPLPFATTASVTESGEVTKMTCPICFQDLTGDNVAVNQHVDSCLNKRFIREEIPQRSTPPKRNKSKERSNSKSQPCIQSFFQKS